MVKVILGYVVMTVLQFALAAIGGLMLGFLVQAITKNAQGYAIEAVFWVFSTMMVLTRFLDRMTIPMNFPSVSNISIHTVDVEDDLIL